MSDGPMSGGLLLKLIGWYSSDLNLHIKKSPNCAACSVACAPPSVHITPIIMSAPLAAAKARIPRIACLYLNAITSPTPAHFPDLLQLYYPSRPVHPSTATRLPQLPLCRCKMISTFCPDLTHSLDYAPETLYPSGNNECLSVNCDDHFLM